MEFLNAMLVVTMVGIAQLLGEDEVRELVKKKATEKELVKATKEELEKFYSKWVEASFNPAKAVVRVVGSPELDDVFTLPLKPMSVEIPEELAEKLLKNIGEEIPVSLIVGLNPGYKEIEVQSLVVHVEGTTKLDVALNGAISLEVSGKLSHLKAYPKDSVLSIVDRNNTSEYWGFNLIGAMGDYHLVTDRPVSDIISDIIHTGLSEFNAVLLNECENVERILTVKIHGHADFPFILKDEVEIQEIPIEALEPEEGGNIVLIEEKLPEKLPKGLAKALIEFYESFEGSGGPGSEYFWIFEDLTNKGALPQENYENGTLKGVSFKGRDVTSVDELGQLIYEEGKKLRPIELEVSGRKVKIAWALSRNYSCTPSSAGPHFVVLE